MKMKAQLRLRNELIIDPSIRLPGLLHRGNLLPNYRFWSPSPHLGPRSLNLAFYTISPYLARNKSRARSRLSILGLILAGYIYI